MSTKLGKIIYKALIIKNNFEFISSLRRRSKIIFNIYV